VLWIQDTSHCPPLVDAELPITGMSYQGIIEFTSIFDDFLINVEEIIPVAVDNPSTLH